MARQKRQNVRHQAGSTAQGGGYWLAGWHPCLAALQNPARQISQVIATRNVADRLIQQGIAPERLARLQVADASQIAALLPPDSIHQGIALKVSALADMDLEDAVASGAPLLLLDQLTDPHNVGALWRSAAAFGVAAVVLTKDHAAPESAVMAKAASGALDIVPRVVVTNLAQAIQQIQQAGYWVIGLAGETTTSLSQALHPSAPMALVLGAEGAGLRRLTREACDELAAIAMDNRMESLNVSNAAAIALHALFEARKPVGSATRR